MRGSRGGPHLARRQLCYLAVVQILAMSLWFSASAVRGALTDEWALGAVGESMLTTSVQLGFVVGAVGSALLNLADRLPAHILMSACAASGAVFNACVALYSDGLPLAVTLRVLTGVTLAGVYPVGMKVMTTWFRDGRGFALGIMVGALTVGSTAPQLVLTLDLSWHLILLISSALATLGSIAALTLVRLGPYTQRTPPFDPRYLTRMLRDRRQRLINLGYLGHMWELYALWAWLPAFVAASFAAHDGSPARIEGVAWIVFATMGLAGAAGCAVAGRLARTVGSVRVARAALVSSGMCCVASPLLFRADLGILAVILAIWGATVIADSAQFSSALSEVAEPGYVGTALTVQTALGFTLTIVSIQGLPVIAGIVGWQYSLLPLAIGPALGAWSLSALLRRGR